MTEIEPEVLPRIDVVQLTRTVTAHQGLQLVLWMLTVGIAIAAGIWAVQGQTGTLELRAGVLARLWPLAAVWIAGLVLWGRNTNATLRKLVETDGFGRYLDTVQRRNG